MKGDERGRLCDQCSRRARSVLPRGASDAGADDASCRPLQARTSWQRTEGSELIDAKRSRARGVEGTRFPTTMPAEAEEIRRRGGAASRRRLDRSARRSELHPQGQRALSPNSRRSASTASSAMRSPADSWIDKYPQFYWNMVARISRAPSAVSACHGRAARQWIADPRLACLRAERGSHRNARSADLTATIGLRLPADPWNDDPGWFTHTRRV